MADIATELAGKTGISAEIAQKGLGVVLGLLKSKLPAESFNKVSTAIPGADNMMAAAADTKEQSGGVVGAVTGAIGKLFGSGDGIGAAAAKLGQIGMKPEQIEKFIPQVLEFLKGKLPDNILGQVGNLLPSTQEAAH
jgi:hypothetical protein